MNNNNNYQELENSIQQEKIKNKVPTRSIYKKTRKETKISLGHQNASFS